jgi:hypothetical protein
MFSPHHEELPWVRTVYARLKHNPSSFISTPEEISLDTVPDGKLPSSISIMKKECIISGIELQPGTYSVTRCYIEYNSSWGGEWSSFTGIRFVSEKEYSYLSDFPMKTQSFHNPASGYSSSNPFEHTFSIMEPMED